MLKDEHDRTLMELKTGAGLAQRVVGLDTMQAFNRHYRQLLCKDMTPLQRKQLVQKFVKKIEVGPKTYKVHYIVDREHYRQELAALTLRSEKKLGNYGSNTLTVGTRDRT